MRYLLALALPVALGARISLVGREDYYEWAVGPDKTADWYKEHKEPIPPVAPKNSMKIVEEEKYTSYLVKLECLGCPFRVRERYEIAETWQEPAQDNSLLLNFTISKIEPSILLNGESILPLTTPPPGIRAYQIPANTTKERMDQIIRTHMLDPSFNLGTKYGQFELQYEHTLLATERPEAKILQLDIKGVHRRGPHSSRSYALNREGQTMVQLYFRSEHIGDQQLWVSRDVSVVERKDKVPPLLMPCGKPALVRTEFNPLEWDYYGKFGTASRTWNQILWKTGSFFDRNGLLVIIGIVVFTITNIVRWGIRRSKERAAAAEVKDDAEAALLGVEYEDDAPPESDDEAPVEEQK